MPRNPKHDVLFTPITIGPHTLGNRFYQVPYSTGFGPAKPGSQAAHRAVKAEGGWGAVCTDFASISPEADETPNTSATMWDEDDAANFALVTEEAHRHGALAGIELHHGGVNAPRRESRWLPLGPSQIADAKNGLPDAPKEMDSSDIKRTVDDWVDAAVRSRDAGFDIVYVYGGHNFLMGQFLSPYFNQRTDQYGGPLENRARLWLETLAAVKEAVGADCAIAARIAIDTTDPRGIPLDQTLEFIGMADPLVDLWDVNAYLDWEKDTGASRFFKENFQLEFTKEARKSTNKPIVSVGRLTNPDQMADLVQSGVIDIVGAARPSIADPFLPKKIEEGRLQDIRECMGINACASRTIHGFHIGCAQNATAGEEYRRGWHPERFEPIELPDKDVLVVGAGPAGMECAMVLGKRGVARVHLVEAAKEIGGSMRWIPQLPSLGEWARLVNHRRIQLDKLRNVEVITNTELDAEAVREYGAEIVVIATGSTWAADGLNGFTHLPIHGADAGTAHVLTPEQIMLEGKKPVGSKVMVYDGDGYFMGASLAEKLRNDGYEVQLVTPHSPVAPFCDETLEGSIYRQRLHDIGVEMVDGTQINQVSSGLQAGRDGFGVDVTMDAESVVLVTQRLSDDSLYKALTSDPAALEADGIEAVYRIGDCAAPQQIADAIFDGHRLARELDGPHPERPLPYLRERPLRRNVEKGVLDAL